MSLSSHPFFSTHRDPESGTLSYILAERVAPIQQSFYFTNPSLSGDERFLWFHTAFPPNPARTLGVVSLDPAERLICHFPQAGFSSESPMVAPRGDACWFCMGDSVWQIDVGGRLERLATLPAEYIDGRHLWRLATHLTCSCDGKHLALDGLCGNVSFLALADRATGGVRIVKEFIAHHNHAQFSRAHPDLILISQDQYRDPITGRFIHHDLRVHLIDTEGRRYECLTPDIQCSPFRGACHEWWTAQGNVAFIDYDAGVFEIDLGTRQRKHVWKEPLCHAHADPTRRYFCADQSPYFWDRRPCQVKFFDSETGRVTLIDSGLPVPPYERKAYHLDPHPQFSPKGTYVVYTTTRRGTIDVALAPTEPVQ